MNVLPHGLSIAELLSKSVFDAELAQHRGLHPLSSNGCVVVKNASKLMYQAAHTVFHKHEHKLREFWRLSTLPLPSLYRLLLSMEWPTLARADVQSSTNSGAKGCCFGLSRGHSPHPYCNAPDRALRFMQGVISSAAAQHPSFRFTSMQVNIGLSAALHADGGNVGPSLVVSLGPHAGGQLWVFRANEGCVLDLEAWTPINGRIPHKNLPHAGDRVSIVLFTHSAAASRNSSQALTGCAMAGFSGSTDSHCHDAFPSRSSVHQHGDAACGSCLSYALRVHH